MLPYLLHTHSRAHAHTYTHTCTPSTKVDMRVGPHTTLTVNQRDVPPACPAEARLAATGVAGSVLQPCQ